MNEKIDFYLLSVSEARARDLFTCRLAEKARLQGMAVYIHTMDEAHSIVLNKLLWTFSQNSFLPHSVYEGNEINSKRFPIQLGCIDNPSFYDGLLIQLSEELCQGASEFKRVAEIVLNDEQSKAAARTRYKTYLKLGVKPKTHTIDKI